MNIYQTIWAVYLYLGTFMGIDEKSFPLFLSAGIATLARVLYERNYSRGKLTTYRVLLILVVSLFLPYASIQVIQKVDILRDNQLLALFFVGLIAIDVVEIIIKVTPQRIMELVNLLPEFFRKWLGLQKREE